MTDGRCPGCGLEPVDPFAWHGYCAWACELRAIMGSVGEVKVLRTLAEAVAAEDALDAIAAACGCPRWEYPGQVVRDVEAARERMREALGAARAEVTVLRAAIREALAPECLDPTYVLLAALGEKP